MTDSVNSLLERADALLAGGDFEAALAALDAASRLDATDPRPQRQRAELWIGLGGPANLRQAWLALVRAIALGLDDLDVHFQLMRTLYELGEWDSAQVAYETALKLDPTNARLREWALRLAVAAGDLPRALDVAHVERAADPANRYWQRWEADLLRQTGDLTAARQVLDSLLAASPADLDPNAFDAAQWADLILQRADVCRQLGDFAAALDDLARAEVCMPGEPAVTFGRGLVAWGQGDPDAAFDLLRAGLTAAAPEVRAAFWEALAAYPRLDALRAALGAMDDD